MKTTVNNPATVTSAGKTGKFRGYINNIGKIGLTRDKGVSFVRYDSTVPLVLDEEVPVKPTAIGKTFRLHFGQDDWSTTVELKLVNTDTVLLASEQTGWSNPETNTFLYATSGPTFTINLVLTDDTTNEVMEIILVGTVPTDPEDGKKK